MTSAASGLTRLGDNPFSEWLDALIGKIMSMPRRQVIVATALTVTVTGIADGLTGVDLWFGPIYLLAILLPAWALGFSAGMLTGVACIGISLAVNGTQSFRLGAGGSAWDLAMRALVIGIIVLLVAACRRSHDREWWRARSDDLTGLLNKQGFYERAGQLHRAEAWSVLAFIDLDGFKQINDTYGHAAGDETLRQFALRGGALVRSQDVFARIGGDEFLVFTQVLDEAAGRYLAHCIHLGLNETLDQLAYPAAASMGVILLPPRVGAMSAAEVRLADALMYDAKLEGAALRVAVGGLQPAPEGAARSERAPAPAMPDRIVWSAEAS